MAHFWLCINNEDYKGLALLPFKDGFDEFVLTGDSNTPMKVRGHHQDFSRSVIIREKARSGDDIFILFTKLEANQEVRINGDPVFAGMRELRDRDEILVSCAGGGSQRLLFSSERKAAMQLLDSDQTCVRCKHIIKSGDYAVCCPQCGSYHHQSELNCWNYSPKCGNGICSQQTGLDSDFRWIPEYLTGKQV